MEKTPTSKPLEKDLLQEWRAGNGGAFGELFRQNAQGLFNLASRLTGNREDAQDLLQSAALRALSTSSPCQNGTTFHAWMRRILIRLFLDSLKARSRAGRDLLIELQEEEDIENLSRDTSPESSPRESLDDKQSMERIETAISGLSAAYRALVILREIEGLSYAEIAVELKIPVETVRTGLRRARNQLRQALTPLLESRT